MRLHDDAFNNDHKLLLEDEESLLEDIALTRDKDAHERAERRPPGDAI